MNRVTTGTKRFPSVIANVGTWASVSLDIKRQFPKQVKIRLFHKRLVAFQEFLTNYWDILVIPIFQYFLCQFFLFYDIYLSISIYIYLYIYIYICLSISIYLSVYLSIFIFMDFDICSWFWNFSLRLLGEINLSWSLFF